MAGINDVRSMLPGFARLEQACFAEPWSEQMLAESLDSGFYVFTSVKEDGELAGYACGLIAGDQGEIARICVLPEFRRRGIGLRLMEELKLAFRAAGCGVHPINVFRARGFFYFPRGIVVTQKGSFVPWALATS